MNERRRATVRPPEGLAEATAPKSSSAALAGVAVAVAGVPLLAAAALHRLFGGGRAPSVELHSTFEVFGCAVGIVVAVLLLRAAGAGRSMRMRLVAFGLVATETLDLFHASVPSDDPVADSLHVVGSLAFGLLALLASLPDRETKDDGQRTAGLVFAASATAGLAILVATRGQAAGAWADLVGPAGALAALLALGAAAAGALRYSRAASRFELLIVVLCGTQAIAGFVALRATSWGVDWWLEHAVRLVGELSSLTLTLRAYSSAESSLRDESADFGAAAGYARSLIEASLDPLMTIDAAGRIADVNEAAVGVTGRSRDELVGSDFASHFTVPADARAGWERAFRDGIVRDVPLEIVRAGGGATPVVYNASVYRDAAGEVAGVFAMARDVTAVRRVEAAAREANAYARSLIEASLDPLMTIGRDGRVTDVNAAAIDVTGLAREALVGSEFADLFTVPTDARAGWQRAFRDGEVRDVALELRAANGNVVSVAYNASVYRDLAGEVAGVFAMARDVTAVRIAEGEARAANAYARSLIEASLDPLMTIGRDGRVTDVNGAAIDATGLARDALVGREFAELFTVPADARAGWQRAFRDGEVRDVALDLRSANGKIASVAYNASVYRDLAGEVAGVFAMARDVTASRAAEWVKEGLARLNTTLRSEEDAKRLAAKTITELCRYLDANVGVIYLADEGTGDLALVGSYAYTTRKNLASRFAMGEGLVGQAALEQKQIVLTHVPDDYVRISSGLGETSPRRICVTPIVFDGRLTGVVEVGTLGELGERQRDFLTQAAHVIGIAIETAQSRARLSAALEKSQRLAEELQVQQEELQASNEELQTQSNALVASERTLQSQQEELRVANEELTEKNELLERQKRDVERAQGEIQKKANELETASRYKSEFLANMSHELRTPLNSLLLLARGLSENKPKNLNDDQVECARVIHAAGTDLLSLINEILDLSKIEAGHMEISVAETSIEGLADLVREGFEHVAAARGIELACTIDDDVPKAISTDVKRLHQILKNLVSNAVKFTEKGGVRVRFHRPEPGTRLTAPGLEAGRVVAVSVTDTGIGIAQADQQRIFEAFQQVDGGIARKYGGTGLGLSISRELVRLLGGELRLVSALGEGSTFTLFLPIDRAPASSSAGARKRPAVRANEAGASEPRKAPPRIVDAVADDRDLLAEGDRCILVVDDDAKFARILVSRCHEHDFKCVVASSGEEGLELARRVIPHAILLDIGLPGIDGWQVLRALKEDKRTRQIPVHVVSAEEPTTRAARQGAIGHATKPTTSEMIDAAFAKISETTGRTHKRVLVVEGDAQARASVVSLLARADVRVDEAATPGEAIRAIGEAHYDCMVLDLGPDEADADSILEALRASRDDAMPPVVVYTSRDVSPERELRLREYTDSIILKTARSEERLLDEVSLFLHKVVGRTVSAPPPPAEVEGAARSFAGRKVLIVDDDMRSSFALSRMLREHGLEVVKAENGQKALAALDAQPDVAIVLMDVMMPIMDGFDAIRRIRAQDRFAKLPILTLTAKAMLGDREKCLAAGANDYLTKPVDPDRLLSALRVWLYG